QASTAGAVEWPALRRGAGVAPPDSTLPPPPTRAPRPPRGLRRRIWSPSSKYPPPPKAPGRILRRVVQEVRDDASPLFTMTKVGPGGKEKFTDPRSGIGDQLSVSGDQRPEPWSAAELPCHWLLVTGRWTAWRLH